MNKKILLSAVSILAITASNANAAGFQLTENSAISLGRAFAGAGVVGDDLSAIAMNPAGMSLFDGTMGVQAGLTAVNVVGDFEGTVGGTATSQDADSLSYVPQFYMVGKINDRFNIGLGVHTPFGLETNYDTDWLGKASGIRSYVATIDINPTLSYKINKEWSFGFGLSAQYLEATLTNNVEPTPLGYVKVKGDSWAYGYNFGFMYEPMKDTRLGLAYRSRVIHDVEGTTYTTAFSEENGTTAKMSLPESITLSGYHKANEYIGLSFTGRWTKWSRFDYLTVVSANPSIPVSSTYEDWRDTWSVGLGIDYYANEDWTFRAGVGFDKGPITSAERRTPRIPDNNRIQLGLGFSYQMNENFSFDFGYMHLFIYDSEIIHENALGDVVGEFTPHSDLFTAAVQYKF